jgi:hypothetical protein
MDPGTCLSIAEIAFQGAMYAFKTFRSGLNYASDSERLILNLEMERFRFQVWGENAGLLTRNGQATTFPDRLLPLYQVIVAQLEGIQNLVQDSDKLVGLYGLELTTNAPTNPSQVRKIVERMQRSIKSCGHMLDVHGGDEVDEMEIQTGKLVVGDRRHPSPWERTRWAIRDLKKFEALVHDLSGRISKLDQLLSESQQWRAREDLNRVNIVVVGSAVDEASLSLILAAVRDKSDTSTIRTAVERRALADDIPAVNPIQIGATGRLSLSDFKINENLFSEPRFLAAKAASPEEIFLFERKPFDPNITPQDKIKLAGRIQRLVMLLKRPKSSSFLTPGAEGCIHDPSRFCWWIILRFPITIATSAPTLGILLNGEPVSLLSLLSSKLRPPLEQRYRLAKAITGTLSELYNSSWLHKGIRSENILFTIPAVPTTPPSSSEIVQILGSPTLCGFDYSRQESDGSTMDKAKTLIKVSTAIYRHPNYQGDAAKGYKIQYDIYSLGLVLVEIALWQPLATFLKSDRPSANGSSARLSPDMQVFHSDHAALLKTRVGNTVEKELMFRVGSSYAAAIQFCLELADRPSTVDICEVPLHPVLEFYDKVVAPLARLARIE